MRVSLLTGGGDPTYALPLCETLLSKGVSVEFVGGNAMAGAEMFSSGKCNYYNLRGDQSPQAPILSKVIRMFAYYYKLLVYSLATDSKIVHVLWPSKVWPSRVVYFDRTVLNIFYRLLGKRLVYTAHNINEGERDGNDTLLNRITLQFMYKFVDHIFVHTEKMKRQLVSGFGVSNNKVTVVPLGINNVVPNSRLTVEDAKRMLKEDGHARTLLAFGQIAPYKGLDLLIEALRIIKDGRDSWRLVIAGNIKEGHAEYWNHIQQLIERYDLNGDIIKKIEFIPDEHVEWYFKAADVAVLPYKHVFQSGVLVLAYNFGLPVIAADVGSLRNDIIEGETGFIFQPGNPKDLADTILRYFESDLYRNLPSCRKRIKEYANSQYSWHTVGEITRAVYQGVLNV